MPLGLHELGSASSGDSNADSHRTKAMPVTQARDELADLIG